MGKVYASSDFHGCSGPAMKLLSYLKEDDKLYYLGDSIDRGSDGLALFDTLTSDPRVIYILGNHEELMRMALKGAIRGQFGRDFDLWMMNGGKDTFDAIDDEDPVPRAKEIIRKIEQLSIQELYKSPKGHSVILEHAGFSVGPARRTHDPIWDREHFFDPWSDDPEDQDTYIVHGHTPVQYLQFHYGYIDEPPKTKAELALKYAWADNPGDWRPQVIRYCDGHKFDIDLCTIASDRVALLDLDTFDVKYFEGDENE